ncbi:MAG: rhodanese-like domain-containing protein [Candidatus Bipolaricaulota bacterium]|nr:rhodanese-like domain-containing protein [Candidatus Bipolaricaulota bacterium]
MRRIIALLAMSLVLASAAAVAAPQIAVDQETYNYPDTIEGIAVVHTFVLSNVGDQELVITNVTVGCHCTTTQLATDRLQPGESVGLQAMLDTNGFSDRVVRYVTVESNDPARPRLTLNLAGKVVERQPYQKPVGDLFYDSYLLIDVRDPAAYATGHLIAAMNAPASQAKAYAAALPPGVLTIIYDQDGSTVTPVLEEFRAEGLASVYALQGGLDMWQKSYGLTRMATGEDASWGAFLDVSGARTDSSSGMLRYYDVTRLRTDFVLIDIRPASVFSAGHLAGAVNLPEASVAEYVRTLPRDTPVVIYSDDGSESDPVAESLQKGGRRAQSLLGGFIEWRKQYGNCLIVASAS